MVGAGAAVLLLAVAFVGGGGQRLQSATQVELGLVLAGALLGATAVLRAAGRAGIVPLVAFAALTALTVASIAWSVNPSDSWEEANRALSYLAVFAGAIAAAHLAPHAWRGVLAGIAVACTVIAVYALMTRVAPGWLAENELYARLREPFGYWNAVGVSAACAVPPLLWLAARREGHAALRALAWPALAVVLVCVMLSYSRGALLALFVGLVFWFAAVPLRLRGAAALGTAILGAAGPVAWAFSRESLSTDALPLDVRADGGAELGALLVLVVVLLGATGLFVNFLLSMRPRSARTRRRGGIALIALLAVLPLVGLGALAATPEGVGGQLSQAFDELTDVDARAPANSPERLTATASVRARYWDEALDVQAEHPVLGSGAGGYATARSRYRSGVLEVRHAHGYVVQVLADLGWAGLLLSLVAFAAWIAAAAKATMRRATRKHRAATAGRERIGLLTLVSVVVVFGVHSLVDWTWFVPGNAAVALLAAGWVAGRGGGPPPALAPAAGRRRIGPARFAWAAGVVALAAALAWTIYQPARAVEAGDQAIERADRGDFAGAARAARRGHELNPLAVEPLWELAVMEHARGNRRGAIAALEEAVRLQPARAETWTRLGRYRLSATGNAQGGLDAFRAAARLDPASPAAASDVIEAYRAVQVQRGATP